MQNTQWTDAQKIASAAECKQKRPNQLYAEVTVYVESLAKGRVTLRAKAKDSPTDAKGSPIIKQSPLDWKDERLWTGCPGGLPTTAGGLPVVGAQGTLYLRSDVIEENNLGYRPKWPTEAGGDRARYASMRIYPLRITVFGKELHSGHEQTVELELFNESQVDPTQAVALQRGEMTVSVSEDVFFKHGLGVPTLRQLQAAKEKIEAHDSSAQELAEAWRIVSMCPRRGAHETSPAGQCEDELAEAQQLTDAIFEARAARILRKP